MPSEILTPDDKYEEDADGAKVPGLKHPNSSYSANIIGLCEAIAHSARARIHSFQLECADALHHYRSAVKVLVKLPLACSVVREMLLVAHLNIGNNLMKENHLDAADASYARALEITRPEETMSIVNLKALQAGGRKKEASQDLEGKEEGSVARPGGSVQWSGVA